MSFAFGIEHEVAFINAYGRFADFGNTTFADFDQIIEQLPVYASDYPQLRLGDAGIKYKRWYIEGFERFQDNEDVISCNPKGIEIRTTIHSSIQGAVTELEESFNLLVEIARSFGFTPARTSFSPQQRVFIPNPPLNPYELERRQSSPEMQTAEIVMLTYGPDLSISRSGMSTDELIGVGRKLTYYSPFIVPFSFSSPFFGGRLWEGYSVRTYLRTGHRPAAMVFFDDPAKQIDSNLSLTQPARVQAEVGRIEFKAFDSCADFNLYAGLLALLKGLMLDNTLKGRATTPDHDRHQLSAKLGFDNPDIYEMAGRTLSAAEQALVTDPDSRFLVPPTKIVGHKTNTRTRANRTLS